MDDLKSSIYSEDSINELIQSLSEHLKFKSNNSSRCNLNGNHSLSSNGSSSVLEDKNHSPYYSPNNSLSSTASDLIQQQQQNVATETYFLMQNLLKNGNLIKEAVRRLKFGNQQIPAEQNAGQTTGSLITTKQYQM